MSASQELGWAWEQWTNWYSHQSCHARFCLEVVWSHSGAKLCQIVWWLQGSKSYHHVFCHLGASLWPSGYESPWQACNSPCSHKTRTHQGKKGTSCETLCVKVFHQILSPGIALKRNDQYFWAGSLVLGKHHLLKTNEHFYTLNCIIWSPYILTGRSWPLACSKARQGNSPTRS